MSGNHRRRWGVRLTIHFCVPGTPPVLDWLERDGKPVEFKTLAAAKAEAAKWDSGGAVQHCG